MACIQEANDIIRVFYKYDYQLAIDSKYYEHKVATTPAVNHKKIIDLRSCHSTTAFRR